MKERKKIMVEREKKIIEKGGVLMEIGELNIKGKEGVVEILSKKG